MAKLIVQYTWPQGGTLTTIVRAKVRNPEALAAMRIEAERLWVKACAELEKYDAPVPSDG